MLKTQEIMYLGRPETSKSLHIPPLFMQARLSVPTASFTSLNKGLSQLTPYEKAILEKVLSFFPQSIVVVYVAVAWLLLLPMLLFVSCYLLYFSAWLLALLPAIACKHCCL